MTKLFRKFSVVIIFLSPILALADIWKPISKCIEYSEIQSHVHVVKVDLQCPGLKIVSTSEVDKCSTATQFAAENNASVVINGDYFGTTCMPLGLSISKGSQWKGTKDKPDRSFIACDKNNQCSIDPPDNSAAQDTSWVTAVGGLQTYDAGKFTCARSASEGCTSKNSLVKHPRTALGLADGGKKMLLIAVEGRLENYSGMTLDELAVIFQRLNISKGINLDGGGSTTMIINGKRINKLPLGQNEERPVANHIGILN